MGKVKKEVTYMEKIRKGATFGGQINRERLRKKSRGVRNTLLVPAQYLVCGTLPIPPQYVLSPNVLRIYVLDKNSVDSKVVVYTNIPNLEIEPLNAVKRDNF